MLTCVVPDLNSCSQVLWLEDVTMEQEGWWHAVGDALLRRDAWCWRALVLADPFAKGVATSLTIDGTDETIDTVLLDRNHSRFVK